MLFTLNQPKGNRPKGHREKGITMSATILTTDTKKTIELDPYYADIAGHVHPYDIDADMCALIQYDEAKRDDEGVWHMSDDDAEWWEEYATVAPEVYELEHRIMSEEKLTWDELMAVKDGYESSDILESMSKYLTKLRTL